MARKSTIDIVNECDNFPYPTDGERYQKTIDGSYRFKLDGCKETLGFMPESIATKIPLNEHWRRDDGMKELVFQPSDAPEDAKQAIQHRDKIFADHLEFLRDEKYFEVLKGWRDEVYPVYGPGQKLLFSMERSASPLFGIITYGVHMTGYVNTSSGMKIWTPKRAMTKQTYPGMMDNTVAGGLSTGESPYGCLVRECMEEASLPEDVVRFAKSCGTMTYFYVRDARAGGEVGLCQPECQYVYDLELPQSVIPKPGDDEAVDFQLLSVQEIKDALMEGKFKPNCALLLVEFFIRHGIITPENEPGYIEIVSRLHRRLQFPTA